MDIFEHESSSFRHVRIRNNFLAVQKKTIAPMGIPPLDPIEITLFFAKQQRPMFNKLRPCRQKRGKEKEKHDSCDNKELQEVASVSLELGRADCSSDCTPVVIDRESMDQSPFYLPLETSSKAQSTGDRLTPAVTPLCPTTPLSAASSGKTNLLTWTEKGNDFLLNPDKDSQPLNIVHEKRSKSKQCCTILHRTFWSVSTLILIILVLGVSLTGLSIWATSYTITKKGTDEVAEKTELTITGSITDHIIIRAYQSLEILLNLLTQFQQSDRLGMGLTEFRKPQGLIALLYSFVQDSFISGIGFASSSGTSISVEEGEGNSTILLKNDGNVQSQYVLNTENLSYGNPFLVREVNETARLWYIYAEQAGGPIWSPIYASSTKPPSLRMALSAPYYKDHEFYGAVYVALNFKDINQFLSNLVSNSSHTRVLIIQADGTIIGSNTGGTDIRDSSIPGGIAPIFASDVSDFVIREATLQLYSRYGRPINITGFVSFIFEDSTYTKRVVAVNTVHTNDNINWVAMVILDESEIAGSITKANHITLAISVSSIAIAVIIAVLIGLIITIPLKKISQQMRKIADMNFEEQKKGAMNLRLYELDNMSSSMKQMQKALNNFQKYVPATVVKDLLRKNKTVNIGVVPRVLTVLFLDIQDFTTITETTDQMILIAVLEEFFTNMSNIITQHFGIIDKYIGDCIMALFNAPSTVKKHECMAVKAALTMHQKLTELNEEWQKKGYPYIQIRIGINTDVCLVGNVGSNCRVSYTALGEGVTIADRLETLNKKYETKTIIGENTCKQVSSHFLCMWLGQFSLKSKSHPFHIYSVVCQRNEATPEQLYLAELNDKARLAFVIRDYSELKRLYVLILELNEDDKSAREWLSRMEQPDFELNLILTLNDK